MLLLFIVSGFQSGVVFVLQLLKSVTGIFHHEVADSTNDQIHGVTTMVIFRNYGLPGVKVFGVHTVEKSCLHALGHVGVPRLLFEKLNFALVFRAVEHQVYYVINTIYGNFDNYCFISLRNPILWTAFSIGDCRIIAKSSFGGYRQAVLLSQQAHREVSFKVVIYGVFGIALDLLINQHHISSIYFCQVALSVSFSESFVLFDRGLNLLVMRILLDLVYRARDHEAQLVLYCRKQDCLTVFVYLEGHVLDQQINVTFTKLETLHAFDHICCLTELHLSLGFHFVPHSYV